MGIGNVTVLNVSNLSDFWLQSGHLREERYWPVIRSVMIDWFRPKKLLQLNFANYASGMLKSSSIGMFYLFSTRFKSS